MCERLQAKEECVRVKLKFVTPRLVFEFKIASIRGHYTDNRTELIPIQWDLRCRNFLKAPISYVAIHLVFKSEQIVY